MSLGAYFASLAPTGAFSFERVVVSIADRFGLSAALPLAMFLPAAWRKDDDVGGLLRSFPSLAAGRFVASTVSVLDLVAFGQTVHQYAARQRMKQAQLEQERQEQRQQAQQQSADGTTNGSSDSNNNTSSSGGTTTSTKQQRTGTSWWQRPWRRSPHPAPAAADAAQRAAEETLKHPGPLDIMRRGASGKDYQRAGGLPNPLMLTEDGVLRVLGLTAEQAADDAPAPNPVAPKALSPLLPDLYNGNGGLVLTHSAAGAARCALMAAVLNRLAANALGGLPAAAALMRDGSSGGALGRAGASGGGDGGTGDEQGGGGESSCGGGGGEVHERFVVQLREGWPEIDSVEDLLDGLGERRCKDESWSMADGRGQGFGCPLLRLLLLCVRTTLTASASTFIPTHRQS